MLTRHGTVLPSLLTHDQEPDRCPDGEEISPDPPQPDGISTWACSHGHFGFLLPSEHLKMHPQDDRVQVCGRKRVTSVPAPVMA
ncbi:hypothetical protein [Kitasatospora sp. NPDC058046]|uniref:hypothetical protein n=1 Tax=Kitasatospora sp. NPDC058046 TaxID=3346312 RepID=UPI0036DA790C